MTQDDFRAPQEAIKYAGVPRSRYLSSLARRFTIPPSGARTLTLADFVIDWPRVREVMGDRWVRAWLGVAEYERIFGCPRTIERMDPTMNKTRQPQEKPIEAGDVVTLRSGGPEMTVDSIDGGLAHCVRFEDDTEFRENEIPVVALKRCEISPSKRRS